MGGGEMGWDGTGGDGTQLDPLIPDTMKTLDAPDTMDTMDTTDTVGTLDTTVTMETLDTISNMDTWGIIGHSGDIASIGYNRLPRIHRVQWIHGLSLATMDTAVARLHAKNIRGPDQ